MLRSLFNEPRREDSGLLRDAMQPIKRFYREMKQNIGSRPSEHERRIMIWAGGFLVALDELEQSLYCAERFARTIDDTYQDEMSRDELDEYHRYIYFYKNGIIRVFSLLDKLGYFLNDYFEVRTDEEKDRFSYFTVLRRMYDKQIERALVKKLISIKEQNSRVLSKLRKQRNAEIHLMNEEILDDLMRAQSSSNTRLHIENPEYQLPDLRLGYEMVCLTLKIVFEFCNSKQ